jgi:hypothetical protein
MTRIEFNQVQEHILQSRVLAELALEIALREDVKPVKGNYLPVLLKAVIRTCEDTE